MGFSKAQWVAMLVFFAAGLSAGFGIGVLAFNLNPNISAVQQIRQNSSAYKFIKPLLAVEIPELAASQELQPLKYKLTNLIASKISQNQADNISIYFREDASRWFNINEDEKFSPASLLKVPTMIAFFKEAESNPEILNKKIYYDGVSDVNQDEYFKSKDVIRPGNYYTINELIRYLVIGSDNNASHLLHENIDPRFLSEVYQDLGIAVPQTAIADSMTTKDYAYFFRILYNATYLNHQYSEKALQLLSEIDFPLGIRAGIPQDVVAAQKFGERSISHLNSKGNLIDDYKELHDCGIIYYPKQHYFLCIMTKGQDFQSLAATIKDISQTVYNWISSQ